MNNKETLFENADVIYSYTRAQAIAENGGGPIRKLFRFLLTLVLWPLFDKVEEDE